jgi:hypothetical protein
LARIPTFHQDEKPNSAGNCQDCGSYEGSGHLELIQRAALKRWVCPQQRSGSSQQAGKKDREEQQSQPPALAAEFFPAETIDNDAKCPSREQDHRQSNVHCEPGHFFACSRIG